MANNDSLSFPGDVEVRGNLRVRGSILPTRPRTELTQEDFMAYPVDLASFRVWDAAQTNLPGTSAADDLGLYTGTWGTNALYLATSDLKAAGATTRYALATLSIPPEYVAGESVRIRFSAGMKTTVADTSATVDVAAYLLGRDGLISGADLVTTAATTINTLTFADKDFDLTATNIDPGDQIIIRVAVAVNDAATATAVIAAIGAVELLLDIQG